MRLLVLGGTAWVGREVAAQARDGGHEVVCAARGTSGSVADGVRLVMVDRDDPHGLDGLARERWDAVVDVTRQPGHARSAATALRQAAAHYVLVSTVSVYAAGGTEESTPLLEPLDADVLSGPEQYGAAKAACEAHVAEAFDERCALVRPGLIAGPGDHTDRTGYWPWRFARPAAGDGRVLVPDAHDHACQVIDVRDLAGWLVSVAADRLGGSFDAVGTASTFGEHLDVARGVAGHDGALVAPDGAWLAGRDVTPWAGPRSLPLWTGDRAEAAGFLARTAERARAAGLTTRPLDVTYADTLAWERQREQPVPRRAGLPDDVERELLAALA